MDAKNVTVNYYNIYTYVVTNLPGSLIFLKDLQFINII